nr:Hsp33 family molecular chaperone HslO [Deltaproteobacteria bacterium]
SVVSTLGADDIDALADEQGGTEVSCNYCGDTYSLSKRELRALAQKLRTIQS